MNRIQGAGVVGITSTIPIEIVFAAGLRPIDLNNRFITHPDRVELVAEAEAAGFPLNFCAWIKGIYSLVQRGGIDRVIGVVEGDCSNTELLLEILREEGTEIIPFEYPADRDPQRLARSLEALSKKLGTSLEAAEEMRLQMLGVREKLDKLDWMTWHEGKISGFENHLWLINSSDMRGDWRVYEAELDKFLAVAARREPAQGQFRLGFAGIPPITDGLYEILEELGAAVVFNEFQRQFSMPGRYDSLVEEYLAYTYPYGTRMRIADIKKEVAARHIDGLIHYIQSFCYRQLQDRAIRRECAVPVLALEFDRPGRPGGRSLTRMEAFMELLEGRRRRRGHRSEGRI